jgi:hypothetical protein
LHADRQATEKKRPQVEKILLPSAARLKNEKRPFPLRTKNCQHYPKQPLDRKSPIQVSGELSRFDIIPFRRLIEGRPPDNLRASKNKPETSALVLYPWRSSLERDLFNAKGRTGLCLAALSWPGPFPTVPQWKCPIVPCPSKVTLSSATSPMSIKKGSSPVRGLWSKPRPFVVTSKLSMPIICYDRRSPIFHLAVS